MGQIKICDKCKRSIAERDIAEGLATEKDGHWTCGQCSGLKRPKEGLPQDVVVLLDEIKGEVKSVLRAVTYKESSVWSIFGAVAQVFVFALIALAVLTWYRPDTPDCGRFILMALIAQVMALTFFVLGK